MHYQNRNPMRARDHRIALMPMARPDGEPSFWTGLALMVAACVAGVLIAAAIA